MRAVSELAGHNYEKRREPTLPADTKVSRDLPTPGLPTDLPLPSRFYPSLNINSSQLALTHSVLTARTG